jgi:hypothetical protein
MTNLAPPHPSRYPIHLPDGREGNLRKIRRLLLSSVSLANRQVSAKLPRLQPYNFVNLALCLNQLIKRALLFHQFGMAAHFGDLTLF